MALLRVYRYYTEDTNRPTIATTAMCKFTFIMADDDGLILWDSHQNK